MRKLDLVVLSDLHLGTYGSHAKEITDYLKSIDVDTIILNGDIIDGWQFKKKYFPPDHYKVLQVLLSKLQSGTKIYYLTGNHDDFLRKFSGMEMGNFQLKDHLILTLEGKKYWFFHGDVFDSSIAIAPWLAKLGGKGYDLLIRINRFINNFQARLGNPPMSFSKKIKNSVKNAVKFINDFENTAIDLAFDEGYDYVICGHIHQPTVREVEKNGKKVIYMNSGDWIENLTALEYKDGEWSLFDYFVDHSIQELNEVIYQKAEIY